MIGVVMGVLVEDRCMVAKDRIRPRHRVRRQEQLRGSVTRALS